MTEDSDKDIRWDRIPDMSEQVRQVTDPVAIYILNWASSPIRYQEQIYKASDQKTIEFNRAAEQDILNAFAKRSLQYVVATVFILSIVHLIRQTAPPISSQVYGLSLDLLGAIVLGRGLISDPVSVADQSFGNFGGWNNVTHISFERCC